MRSCSITGWHEDWLRDLGNLEVIRRTDVFFPNEREAAAITGTQDPAGMLDFFGQHGVSCIAIKLGKMGAVMFHGGVNYSCSGFAVGTTGDAFNSGFIHALLERQPPQRCLEIACLTGALSTRAAGALPDEVKGLVLATKASEGTAIQAALDGSLERAQTALLLYPPVGEWEPAEKLLQALIEGDPEHLGYFRKPITVS